MIRKGTAADPDGRGQVYNAHLDYEAAKAFYPKPGYRCAGITEFFFENFIRENLVCFEKAMR